MMDPQADGNLVMRAADGDHAAFTELCTRYGPMVLALLRRQVSDAHDREDVLQETLLQAWLGLPSLRDPTRFVPWLLAVARNRCRNLARSAGRREISTQDEELEVIMTRMGRTGAFDDTHRQAQNVINRVPETQREAARMYYLDGQAIREIAQKLSRSEGTIKSRLFHARRSIFEQIDAGEL